MLLRRLLPPLVAVATLAGCGGGGKDDVCSNEGGELSSSSFVFVQSPSSGERVSSGFEVSGCSSTFEGTVVWGLAGKNGKPLARGSAQGGSQEPGTFSFRVEYTVPAAEVGRLVVSAPRVTNEGFPPVTNVIPLVLDA